MISSQTAPMLVRARFATTIAYVVQGFSLAILVTHTPAIMRQLDLSDGELALLLVLVPVVAAGGSVIAGLLAPRLGSKTVLRFFGPIVPLSVVVVGFSSDIGLTVFALVVFGVALGVSDAAMNMQATSVQHGYGRPIISSCYAWLTLASILGALLSSGEAVLEVPLGAFFLSCAAVVVPVQVFVGRYLTTDVATEMREEPATVPWGPVILIGLGLMCASAVDSAATNWSAAFMVNDMGASEAIAALGFAVYSFALLLGQVFVDRLDARFGPVALVRTGAALGIAAVLVIAIAPTQDAALFGFALLGLSVSPMLPLAYTAGASHDPDRSGRAIARINVFYYVGLLLGAPSIGLIAEASSMRMGFALIVVGPIVILALARAFRAPRL